LEEYLNDPNFEQNRIEYKTNKDNAERQLKKNGITPSVKKSESKGMQRAGACRVFPHNFPFRVVNASTVDSAQTVDVGHKR